MRQIHIVTGAAGVGKSTYARTLACELSAALLDSDTLSEAVVRAGMKAAGLNPTDRDSSEYKTIFRDAVYECLFETAAENLAHTSVVLVGPFTRELQDAQWPRRLAVRLGVEPTIWFLTCADQTRRERIAARGNPRDQLKLRAWDVYLESCSSDSPAFEVNRIET